MIAATHICKRFGKIEAVKDVSVTVKKGEVFGSQKNHTQLIETLIGDRFHPIVCDQ